MQLYLLRGIKAAEERPLSTYMLTGRVNLSTYRLTYRKFRRALRISQHKFDAGDCEGAMRYLAKNITEEIILRPFVEMAVGDFVRRLEKEANKVDPGNEK